MDLTKTLSIYDSYPRAKSRGVVVNHAGLWIHVVVVHWPLIEESPRLRFESARDYTPFEAVPRWGSMVILWPCGGHDAGSNLALGLLFSYFFRSIAFYIAYIQS